MWRLVRCGLHPPPRSPVRTDVSRSLTNSPPFAGISAVEIPAVRSLRRMKTARRRFGAFRLLASEIRFPAGGEGAARDSVRMRQRPVRVEGFERIGGVIDKFVVAITGRRS
jgi:predicted oxidoreductase